METIKRAAVVIAGGLLCLAACSSVETTRPDRAAPVPREVIDLGALVTEDLPERVWGKAALEANGFTRPNAFDVIHWEFETEHGSASGSNAYYTLFNHGGPHVDAPNHVGVGPGLDSYPVEAFAGPLRVFDVRGFPKGRTVPASVFEGSVRSGDVVLIFTGYTPPRTGDEFPDSVTLTWEAAEYLATLPIRAFGTDSLSVFGQGDTRPSNAETETARAVPIHHSFLSRGIPIYEQLFNVEKLLNRERMYFVGVPLNIRDGDGMIVRPVVFLY